MWHGSTVRGSKHSLSDSEAGTEQSPASHRSWQGSAGCLAAVDHGGGSGDREKERRGQSGRKATKCNKAGAATATKTRQSWLGFVRVPMCSHQ